MPEMSMGIIIPGGIHIADAEDERHPKVTILSPSPMLGNGKSGQWFADERPC
jgi:hypothetical protein